MSALAFFTEKTDWETGDLVCIDSSNGYAVAYDENDSKPVVGAALRPEIGYNPNGRNWFCINGGPYYENDFYEWKEDLTGDFTTENPNFIGFNPLTDSGYVCSITNGISAVKNTITVGIPSSWILLEEKTDFNWYLIR